MAVPYEAESLREEILRMEQQIELFEAKKSELRDQIAQYRVWIAEHETEERNARQAKTA